MVQVLPETSNSNIWQQAARDATVGYLEGTKIRKEREKERDKKALFAAATDPNKSPMDRTRAMEQYIGEHGEVGDIIKFQKEQGRMQVMNDIKKLLGYNEPTDTPEATTENLGLANTNLKTQENAPPVTAEAINQPQANTRAPKEELNKALLNLAAYAPNEAKTIGDILNRDQKDKIAADSLAVKTQALDNKKEEFRQNKIIPIQEHAMETIKNTNVVLKATNDQLAAINADSTGIWSMANISQLLRDSGHETLANAVQTEGGAAFVTAGKEIFTGGFKRAFGSKPLGIEFNAFEGMLAQVGRKKEVNELVVKSIQAEYEIANDVAKYQMQLIANNPQISPVELNTQSFQYEEQVTDRVFNEWEGYRDRALEAMKQKSNWFGLGKTPTQEKTGQTQKRPLGDIWK